MKKISSRRYLRRNADKFLLNNGRSVKLLGTVQRSKEPKKYYKSTSAYEKRVKKQNKPKSAVIKHDTMKRTSKKNVFRDSNPEKPHILEISRIRSQLNETHFNDSILFLASSPKEIRKKKKELRACVSSSDYKSIVEANTKPKRKKRQSKSKLKGSIKETRRIVTITNHLKQDKRKGFIERRKKDFKPRRFVTTLINHITKGKKEPEQEERAEDQENNALYNNIERNSFIREHSKDIESRSLISLIRGQITEKVEVEQVFNKLCYSSINQDSSYIKHLLESEFVSESQIKQLETSELLSKPISFDKSNHH